MRGEDKQVGRVDQVGNVVTETEEEHLPGDSQPPGLPLERVAEVPVAGQREADFRMSRKNRGHGVQQERMAFVIGEHGDREQQPLRRGQRKRLTPAEPIARGGPRRGDAIVDDAKHPLRQAVVGTLGGHGLRNADHAVGQRPVTSRRTDGKIEPPRGDADRNAQSQRRQTRAGKGVGVVEVQHVGPHPPQRAAQLPDGPQAPTAAGEGFHVEAFTGHPPEKQAVAPGQEEDTMTATSQSMGQQPGLLFTAPPGRLRRNDRDGKRRFLCDGRRRSACVGRRGNHLAVP